MRHVRLAPLSLADADHCKPFFFEPAVLFFSKDELAGALDTQTATAAECCRQCAEASACTHWTWLTSGTCQLKRGSIDANSLPWERSVVSGRVPVGLRADRLAAPLDAKTSARVAAQQSPSSDHSISEAVLLDPTLVGADPALLLGLGVDPALIPALGGGELNDLGAQIREFEGNGTAEQGNRTAEQATGSAVADVGGSEAPAPALPPCRWEPEDAPALEAGLARCGRPARQPPSALPLSGFLSHTNTLSL